MGISGILVETDTTVGKEKRHKKKTKKRTKKKKKKVKKKSKDKTKKKNTGKNSSTERTNLENTNFTDSKSKKNSNSKKSRNKQRCNWYKRNVQIEKRKMKDFKKNNCNRAKTRGKMSYNTLWTVYNQLFDTIHYNNNLVNKQVSQYRQFLTTVTEFLGKSALCSSNPQWNKVMIERKMMSFQLTCIEELSEHCLYSEPKRNDSRSIFTDEEFAVVRVPLDNVDKSKVDECIGSY